MDDRYRAPFTAYAQLFSRERLRYAPVSSVMQCSAFPAGVPHASLCRDKLRALRFSMLSMLSCGV